MYVAGMSIFKILLINYVYIILHFILEIRCRLVSLNVERGEMCEILRNEEQWGNDLILIVFVRDDNEHIRCFNIENLTIFATF